MTRNRILLAEDNHDVRYVEALTLERSFPDYITEQFKDGGSLVKRLEMDVSDVALIVTDNQMPVMEGNEIIRNYAPKLKGVPFVLVYGGEEEIGERAVREGAFGYMLKPKFDLELLKKALEFSK